jgi:hypothetical protein
MKKPEELAAALRRVAENWECGATVWHRGCGKRGVIIRYSVDGEGTVMPVVCFDAENNGLRCYEYELSAEPVPDDDEFWKSRGEEGTGV